MVRRMATTTNNDSRRLPIIPRQRPTTTTTTLRWNSNKGNNNQDDDSDDDRKIDPKNSSRLDPRLSEWIPPDRPLVGDKGYSHLYENNSSNRRLLLSEKEELDRIEREVKLLEDEENLSPEEQLQRIEEELKIIELEEEEKRKKQKTTQKSAQPLQPTAQPHRMDSWLQSRREKFGDEQDLQASSSLTPSYDRPGGPHGLPILHHTLLTAQEIMDFLVSLGGVNANLIRDKVTNEHGDTRLGGAFRGIIFASGNSAAHVRMLATSLVEQLKLRKLQEVGVVGARHGAEGSDDGDETWFCINCHNYAVNIMDEPTRRMMNLEDWWSQADPMAEYYQGGAASEEDAMDEFVARNPVPPDYGNRAVNWNETISGLKQKRWTAPQRSGAQRPSGRRGGKKGGKGKRRR